MTYTIGASHGPFTGNGSFAISKPAGIRSILSGIPSHTGHDGNIPRRYFKLGRMTLGNSHGFQFSHGLEYVQQLLYPVAPVWEILAYDIKDGASCTFYELVDVPDLTLKQPWDRTPLAVALNTGGQYAAPQTNTTIWSYTVPVGRRLLIGKCSVRILRVIAPTTLGYANLSITVGGTSFLSSQHYSGVLGAESKDDLGGSPIILNAGNVITAVFSDGATGGSHHINASFFGTLFDA